MSRLLFLLILLGWCSFQSVLAIVYSFMAGEVQPAGELVRNQVVIYTPIQELVRVLGHGEESTSISNLKFKGNKLLLLCPMFLKQLQIDQLVSNTCPLATRCSLLAFAWPGLSWSPLLGGPASVIPSDVLQFLVYEMLFCWLEYLWLAFKLRTRMSGPLHLYSQQRQTWSCFFCRHEMVLVTCSAINPNN